MQTQGLSGGAFDWENLKTQRPLRTAAEAAEKMPRRTQKRRAPNEETSCLENCIGFASTTPESSLSVTP